MQVAVPLCVLAPVIETDTVVLTPAAMVHAPPTFVTVAFVVYGKVRAVPFTDVTVTVGADVWTVIAFAPLVPVLAAVSVCVVGDVVRAARRQRRCERVGPRAGGARCGAVLRSRIR